MSTTIELPGFADPVHEAQATFRAVLDAMARPGTLHDVGDRLTPPAPLDQATAAVLLTLLDSETPLWLDPSAARAQDWLAFHCGATIGDAAHAAFAVAVAVSMPDLAIFPAGSHEVPEASTTLILQVASLGSGTGYRLSGPGLRRSAVLAADGLPADFAGRWQRNNQQYPCGIDIVLCAGTTLAALPRSVSVEAA
ncbi:MAG TPA: phosphonate C-P lyase system protein PhnH [Acetobacteraceae bacterium]|nr:phosphonate C-P lyase system protein PhnH [Acetobacteraceae bacterium]